MKTQERFLADQLLAILHGCPGALTTAQIASAAPPLLEIYNGCDPTWHVRSRSSRTLEEICCGEHHLHVRTRFAREIYQTLRTMAAAGEVECLPLKTACDFAISSFPCRTGTSLHYRPVSPLDR